MGQNVFNLHILYIWKGMAFRKLFLWTCVFSLFFSFLAKRTQLGSEFLDVLFNMDSSRGTQTGFLARRNGDSARLTNAAVQEFWDNPGRSC